MGDKFVETKDYTYETYDSAKTYTYDTTLSLVENAKAMAEKMMLAMGSRKEAPETVAAEDEVMERLGWGGSLPPLFVAYKSW